MERLPFGAMTYGHTRAAMLGFVLHDMRREHRNTAPIRPGRKSARGFWTDKWACSDGRINRARRTAHRFLAAQIAAHERALEAML